MRALAQRVFQASVIVDGTLVSHIGVGLLVFLGIKFDDTSDDTNYIIRKLLNLRVFPDNNCNMNKSVVDVGGEILLVSQFTLYGDCRKGNRPSFAKAMPPEKAKEFYANFLDRLKSEYKYVKDGIFGADMKVSLVNDGPVTIFIDSVR